MFNDIINWFTQTTTIANWSMVLYLVAFVILLALIIRNATKGE